MFCFGIVWSQEHALNEYLSAHALLDAQGEILEGMARGAALGETAEGIARLVERLVPPAMCAIALVHPDGRRLKPLAAPSLSHHYFTALDGLEIAPNCGSTGTAAWRREPVIVADTVRDPLWKNLQDFASACDIRSSWALPILHTDSTVLGVLALYYREPRTPGDWDWSAVNSCIKLVRLALAAERRSQELVASETRWRIGAELAGVGSFDVDYRAGVDRWSPAMRQILGVTADAPACFQTFIDLLHPDDRSGFLSRYPEAPLPKRSGRWREELRIRQASTGEVRIITTIGTVIGDEDGNPLHAVGTVYDVTENRRREAELEHARTEAEAANRAKSKFLASMSHELRTPLNAIIGFSDLIKSHVFGPMSPPRYESYVEDIHKSGTHLLSLINDVLDMAKIEAQKFELVRTCFPLQRLADGALLLVRPQALAKQIDLVADICDGSLTLDADERAMRQVLVNLLSNAVKFTNAGGRVRLFAERTAEGCLALGVEDTGAGMSPEGIRHRVGTVRSSADGHRNGTYRHRSRPAARQGDDRRPRCRLPH